LIARVFEDHCDDPGHGDGEEDADDPADGQSDDDEGWVELHGSPHEQRVEQVTLDLLDEHDRSQDERCVDEAAGDERDAEKDRVDEPTCERRP